MNPPHPRVSGAWPTLLLLLATLFAAAAARGGIACSITPSSISNTYSGSITLLVTGLTNGQSVLVQKYMDANGNGVIDAGDPLVQQFTLTDGNPGMVMGGITNMNVPGDRDATPGQITAKYKFANGDFIQSVVGTYGFVLTTPGGGSPITNFFTVTNVPSAQTLSGTVLSSGTAGPVPNAVVLLFPPPRPGKGGPGGNPVAGTAADAFGNYSIMVPPGSYLPAAFQGGYVTSLATASVVALGAGQSVATNLTVAAATATISGSVVDANNAGLGLPGVFLTVQTATGLIGVGRTDASGNFTAGVQSSPSQWYINPNDTSLNVLGYVGLQSPVPATAGQAGFRLPLALATAFFYGTVTDSQGNALPGIDVNSSDATNYYNSDALTDSKGNYFATALAGNWGVQTSGDGAAATYVFSSSLEQTLTNGEAVGWNFTALLSSTNLITGSLKDNHGNPLAGVGMWASTTVNNTYYNQGNGQTDTSGNYSLAVPNGVWMVGVNIGGGGNSLPAGYICSTNQTLVVSNQNATANFLALAATNAITGSVLQANGTPLVGLALSGTAVINGAGFFTETGTGGGGAYSMAVPPGTWEVTVFCTEGSGEWSTLDNLLGRGNYLCPAIQSVPVVTADAVANFIVAPPVPLQMSTNALAGGTVGQIYNQQITASGGTPPYSWFLPQGSVSLPPTASGDMGFTTSVAGATIAGVPSLSGTYPFPVAVYDSASPPNVVTQFFSITIRSAASPPSVGVNLLPTAYVGAYYSQSLSAFGGVPPYTWSIPPYSAAPPANVLLATNGILSGIPAASGLFYFFVRVTDSVGSFADSPSPLSLNVSPAALQITTTSLPNGTLGVPYSMQLSAQDGMLPYTWRVAPGSGALPAGLGLGTTGLLSGTPATNGTASFLIEVTDSLLATAYQVLSITVNPRPVLSLPRWGTNRFQMRLTGAAGQNYTVQMATSLTASNWTTLFATNNLATNSFNVIDPGASDRQRFYRVIVGP